MTLPWNALKKPVLTPSERKRFARATCADFKLFCRLCGPPEWGWGIEDSGHDKIADVLCSTEKGPDGIIRTHVEAPRDGGKSALLERHAAWRICRSAVSWPDEPFKDGSIRILFTCETLEKATDAGEYVLAILTDSDVTKVFGSFRNPKRWSPEKFTIAFRKEPHPHPTWGIGSPKKSTAGFHPLLIYVDDVETHESTKTIDRMMKTRGWFDELQVQLEPGGEERVAGTRYDENDCYGYILDQGDIWNVEICTIENSNFPILTPEFIEGKRQTMLATPNKFACSYLNNPWPSQFQTFRLEDIIQCEYTSKIKALPRYMLTDVAGSKSDAACETALWIVSLDHLGNLYLIDLIHGRFDPAETMDHMTSMWIRWNPMWFVMENRVLTTWALPLIRAKERETGIHMGYRLASGRGYAGKEHHILQLQPRFREQRIYFCDSLPESEIIFEDFGKKKVARGPLPNMCVRFPRAKLKDVLDALAYVDNMDKDGAPLCPLPKKLKREPWSPVSDSKSQWSFPKFRRGQHASFREEKSYGP